MDSSTSSFGGLIPLWILGAPFVIALFEWFTTPKPAHRSGRDEPRTAHHPMGTTPDTVATARAGGRP